MGMQTYVVADSNPISIWPAGKQGSCTILNTGASTVYIADANTGRALEAYALNPQGTIQWNASTPLYAFTLSGERSTVIVNDASVQLANTSVTATIDGPVDANITDPVSVTGTVAATILNDVIVNRGPGVVLYNGQVTSAANIYSTLVNNINATAYSSLVIQVWNVQGPDPAGPTSAYPSGYVEVIQYDGPSAALGVSMGYFPMFDTHTAYMRAVVPVNGVNLTVGALKTWADGLFNVKVTGYRSVAVPSYVELPWDWMKAGVGPQSGNGANFSAGLSGVLAAATAGTVSKTRIPSVGGVVNNLYLNGWGAEVTSTSNAYPWVQDSTASFQIAQEGKYVRGRRDAQYTPDRLMTYIPAWSPVGIAYYDTTQDHPAMRWTVSMNNPPQ